MLLRLLSSFVVLALAGVAGMWLWRRVGRVAKVSARAASIVAALGAALAVAAVAAEIVVLKFTGLSFSAGEGGQGGALLAMLLLAAPLEEGLKVLLIWPLYSSRKIRGRGSALVYAVAGAAGFGAAEGLVWIWTEPPSWLVAARVTLALPAHLLSAGFWGYALGSGRSARGRWFSITWLVSMLVHGLYDHILWGRGPALLFLTVPLLAAGGVLAFGALKELGTIRSAVEIKTSSRRFVEPPSLATMREALSRSDRPLLLHWIAIGALVTLGIMLVSLASAVYLGHRLGLDFAIADEADVRSSGPIVLLACAVLAAFPVSGYLVARASSASSVLEPALGAAIALAALVLAVSVTAPIAVVFALAVAPVAFALACGGAWIGMEH